MDNENMDLINEAPEKKKIYFNEGGKKYFYYEGEPEKKYHKKTVKYVNKKGEVIIYDARQAYNYVCKRQKKEEKQENNEKRKINIHLRILRQIKKLNEEEKKDLDDYIKRTFFNK